MNADAVRRFLADKGVPDRKIVTIYNGLDFGRLTAGGELPAELTRLLNPNESTRFVTIVANMRDDVKNHRMFLRAAKRVKDANRNAEFLLAGEGELVDSLRSYANELGVGDSCHFLGRCANVGRLLSASDVCVLSSRSEGFSNSILEYMAAGKPVVSTCVGGAEEAVIDAETGYLVPSDDDAEMAARIVDLLSDQGKAAEFGRRGREEVESRFTPAAQLRRTLELYSQLIDGGRS